MLLMCQMPLDVLTALCLLQGPPGGKGERGERVSEEPPGQSPCVRLTFSVHKADADVCVCVCAG